MIQVSLWDSGWYCIGFGQIVELLAELNHPLEFVANGGGRVAILGLMPEKPAVLEERHLHASFEFGRIHEIPMLGNVVGYFAEKLTGSLIPDRGQIGSGHFALPVVVVDGLLTKNAAYELCGRIDWLASLSFRRAGIEVLL